MLPSAHPARSAMALVVAPFRPRSLISSWAAARMWSRVPMISSVAIRGGLLVVVAHVAPDEERRDDGGQDQEADRHEDPDVDGMDEGALHGLRQRRAVGPQLSVAGGGAGPGLGHDRRGLGVGQAGLHETGEESPPEG